MSKDIVVKGSKSYGDKQVFCNLDLVLKEGQINCILGYSGSGKTTLLNMICRMTDFEGNMVNVPDEISYIFQEPRLIPSLTVRENIEYVLEKTDINRDANVNRVLEMVELTKEADNYPKNLSGGMAQRVAIARAFAFPSRLLLMDEPFKALDIGLKRRLFASFIKLWESDNKTTVFVTHGIDEALLLADRIYVLSGEPSEVIYKCDVEKDKKFRTLADDDLIKIRTSLLKLF